jgi:hypothetical protein
MLPPVGNLEGDWVGREDDDDGFSKHSSSRLRSGPACATISRELVSGITQGIDMELGERVWQLERRLQRQQFLGLGLVALVAVAVLSGAQKTELPVRKPVETTAVKLFDDAGKFRGLLAVTPRGNAGLAFIQENGKIGATLGVGKDGGASLELSHSDGKLRARLTLAENGDPVLQLYDSDGKVTKHFP